MRTHHEGRHENGQNFLVDRTAITDVVDLVARTRGPILEIGPGGGALTLPLQSLGRPLTAVEVDPDRVRSLRRRVAPGTSVVHADFLRHPLPTDPHVLVGNLPFHLTTAMLRRVVHAGHWTDAVLLVQWEVARRRAGVGGATMMTAQWWPWYAFTLVRRVPAAAFHPRPSVDGGLMTVTRREVPLVDARDRRRYQSFVHRVFTGRGRGVPAIVRAAYPSPRTSLRTSPRTSTRTSDPTSARPAAQPPARTSTSIAASIPAATPTSIPAWARRHGITDRTLPRDLTARQWAELFALCC
ncbi:23S ribosomal RNA methyltransferase Erm [Actinosynnema sp. NPDC023658]|uniref:23S ribosomal RNA methyltransferase Erm n=1 Tax=Actinosynnema sp. NPDC023658 TaxID=3155465 RepID=UPI0033FAD126